MPGLCNCSVGTSVFFFMIHQSRSKTNNVAYANGDHESTHFYELLPSCSSKNTPSNASKRPPAGGVVWWVFQLGDYDHCRRDVFGPYILVWRGRKKLGKGRLSSEKKIPVGWRKKKSGWRKKKSGWRKTERCNLFFNLEWTKPYFLLLTSVLIFLPFTYTFSTWQNTK